MSHSRNQENDERPNLSRSHAELSKMILQGRSFSGLERNCSFLNTRGHSSGGRFATISALSGLDFPDDGRALAVVDWDHDGDLDIWFSARNAPRIRLMQNRTATGNHFLVIGLQGNGVTTSRDAVGARVEVVLEGEGTLKNIQTLRAGEGFLSQDSKWLHFGLGREGRVDHVEVSWPGGEKERFGNIDADGRYLLIQGSGSGVAAARRTKTQIEYQQSEPILPKPAGDVRIPLMTRMPMPQLPVRNYQGQQQIVEPGAGGPVLVTLWASWCPSCKAELSEFVKRKDELQKAGLGILALSVDGLGDERSDVAAGRKLLNDLQFPFPVAVATQELVQKFQQIHDLIIPLKMPLPVPASFLFDGKGQLAVIYKGRASVDKLIADTVYISTTDSFGLEAASPFTGKSIANEDLERVVRSNKVRMLFKRGAALAEQKNYQEAVLYNQKALELFPDSYKIHFNLGTAHLNSNNLESAIFHLNKSYQSNPQFHLSHKVLGKLYLRAGRFEEATRHYQTYLSAQPDDAEAINSRAIIAIRTGALDEAERLLERAIDLDSSFVEARFNLAALQIMQNKISTAENSFLQILSIQPNYPDVLYNIGYIAELEGDMQRAVNLYTGELRNSPQSVKAITGIARVMERSGNYEQAKKYYSHAVEVNPSFQPAVEGLNRLKHLSYAEKTE